MTETRETGKVVEIINDGLARVLLRRKKWCDHCASKDFCNPPAEEEKEFSVEVDNPVGARIGDLVEIGLERGALFVASVWAYLVPSVLFVIGLATGYLALSRLVPFVSREIVGLVFGILLLAVSFVLLRLVNNWLGKKGTFHPHITAICTHKVHSD